MNLSPSLIAPPLVPTKIVAVIAPAAGVASVPPATASSWASLVAGSRSSFGARPGCESTLIQPCMASVGTRSSRAEYLRPD